MDPLSACTGCPISTEHGRGGVGIKGDWSKGSKVRKSQRVAIVTASDYLLQELLVNAGYLWEFVVVIRSPISALKYPRDRVRKKSDRRVIEIFLDTRECGDLGLSLATLYIEASAPLRGNVVNVVS